MGYILNKHNVKIRVHIFIETNPLYVQSKTVVAVLLEHHYPEKISRGDRVLLRFWSIQQKRIIPVQSEYQEFQNWAPSAHHKGSPKQLSPCQ